MSFTLGSLSLLAVLHATVASAPSPGCAYLTAYSSTLYCRIDTGREVRKLAVGFYNVFSLQLDAFIDLRETASLIVDSVNARACSKFRCSRLPAGLYVESCSCSTFGAYCGYSEHSEMYLRMYFVSDLKPYCAESSDKRQQAPKQRLTLEGRILTIGDSSASSSSSGVGGALKLQIEGLGAGAIVRRAAARVCV